LQDFLARGLDEDKMVEEIRLSILKNGGSLIGKRSKNKKGGNILSVPKTVDAVCAITAPSAPLESAGKSSTINSNAEPAISTPAFTSSSGIPRVADNEQLWTTVVSKRQKKVATVVSMINPLLREKAAAFLSNPVATSKIPSTKAKNNAEEECGLRQIYISGKQVLRLGGNHKQKLPYSVLRKQLGALGIYPKSIKDIQYIGNTIELTVRASACWSIEQVIMKYEGAIKLEKDFDPSKDNGSISKENGSVPGAKTSKLDDLAKARFISRCKYLKQNAKYIDIRNFYGKILAGIESEPQSDGQDSTIQINKEALGLNQC
jgi:hypothetical protein